MKLSSEWTRAAKLIVGFFLLSFLAPQETAFGQTPFYQGKTITLIRGSTPGGIGEMRLRALVPHLRKHIPGQPTILIEFMEGGGGRKAANHVYTRSDGLTIGSTPGGILASAILSEPGVMYDLDKLIFLGSSESESHYSFLTRREGGWDSLEKLQAATGVRIGSHAVGHPIYITGRFFAYFLGLKSPKFITGYSSPEQDVALSRGEIDARSETSLSIVKRHPEWIDKGIVHLHAVIEIPKGKKVAALNHLPDLEKFTKSEKDRRILSMFRLLRGAGSPYFVGPGTPKERVQTLQAAFRQAFDDPEFEKEYKKVTGDDPSPIKPEDYQNAIREIPRDPEIIELYKKFSGGDPLPTRQENPKSEAPNPKQTTVK
jgi:tripartite-type tricarboxylate transporter receptor subunit TctC